MFAGQGGFGQVFLCKNVLDWKARVGFQGRRMCVQHTRARCAIVDAAARTIDTHGHVVRPLMRLHVHLTRTDAPCVY